MTAGIHRQDDTTVFVELPGKRVRLQWLDDIKPQLSAPWLVSGLLPLEGLALIFGESGSGKTYLATDIALHVASGAEWAGRRARPGVVVYVAAENPASLERRASLWRQLRGQGGEPFAMVSQPIDLLGDVDELIASLRAVAKEHGRIAMVLFDTVARSMVGGDENSAQDVGRVVASCDRVRESLHTCVALIHHAGKDSSKGARGHSSLRAAVDTEIEVTANGDLHFATVTKQRDGETGTRFQFRLEPHELGTDDEGEAVTACLVVDLAEASETKGAKPQKLTNGEKVALDALHAVLDVSRKCAGADEVKAGAKLGQIVADFETWRAECYAKRIAVGGSDALRVAFNRALGGLQAKGRICVHGEATWLA